MKIILGLFLFPLLSQAFTLNSLSSSFRGWPSGEVKFAINPNNCPAGINIRALMEDSFKVWNNIPSTSLKLTITGETASTSAADPVTVFCATDYSAISGSPDPDNIPGAAVLGRVGDNAVSGYIFLNATSGDANIGLFNPEVLKLIIAHEVGHIIGLGHSHETTALMYYDASAKNTMKLAQDDVDGVTYLYPRDELSGDQMMGCGMVKTFGNNNMNFPKGLSYLLCFLLPLILAWRLRNRPQLNPRSANSLE